MLGGLALGALAMYIFDPVQGNRRRAAVRDKLHNMTAGTRSMYEAKSRDRGNRPQAANSGESAAYPDEPGTARPETMSQSSSAP